MLPSILADMSLKAACSAAMASVSLAAVAEFPRALASTMASSLCIAACNASTSVWSAFPSTTNDTLFGCSSLRILRIRQRVKSTRQPENGRAV